MDNKPKTTSITWILRSAAVLAGLALTACAPMALPGEEGAQPASAGVAQLATATPISSDDSNTVTPGATQTTPEATHTAQPGMTGTAVTGQSVEFTGTIEMIDASALVVSGRRVVITAATEIKFQPQKGLTVKVEGTLQADGTVLAREIKSVPAGQATQQPDVTRTPGAETTRTPQGTRQAGETEFRGTVSAINGNTFVVNGITVVVNGEIKGPIAVGDLVKVHGVTQADGSVIAREIERVGTAGTPQGTRQAGETEFRGTVSAINGNTFVVNGITVVVNGEIKGLIAVGDLVKVHGVTQADGSVIAREIERADLDDSGSDDDDSDGRGSDDDGSDDRGGDDDDGNSGDDDNSGHDGDDDGNGGDDDSSDGDDDDNSGHDGDDDGNDGDDDDNSGHGGDDDQGDDD